MDKHGRHSHNEFSKRPRRIVRIGAVLGGLAMISLGVRPLLLRRGYVYENWWGDPVFVFIPIVAGLLVLFIAILKPKWLDDQEAPSKSRFRG